MNKQQGHLDIDKMIPTKKTLQILKAVPRLALPTTMSKDLKLYKGISCKHSYSYKTTLGKNCIIDPLSARLRITKYPA